MYSLECQQNWHGDASAAALSLLYRDYPATRNCIQALELVEMPMKKLFSITNVLATAGVLLAGYVLITSIPDMRRYIRISTM